MIQWNDILGRRCILLAASLLNVTGCCPAPGKYAPLIAVAPTWDAESPTRRAAEQSIPKRDPLALKGYLSDAVFGVEEFCRVGANGTSLSEPDVVTCERDSCLMPLEVDSRRARSTVPWALEEIENCLSAMKKDETRSYDELSAAFDEPVLWGQAPDVVAYRLYVVESHSLAYRMTRVVRTSAGVTVVAKRLEATEVPGQGRLAWRHAETLQNQAWDVLVGLVGRSGYWFLPPRVRKAHQVQFDGSLYRLEAVDGERQHFVSTSNAQGALGELIRYLEGLAACDHGCTQRGHDGPMRQDR